MYNQTRFGGMLQDIVELTSIVLHPELLDLRIELRYKRAWEDTPKTHSRGDSHRLRALC